MSLDPDICYNAVRSRDARFDGRFFTAVRSTGIYCRPICPARLPGRHNVEFYSCAAAAEAAGFRPCRRCRPETSPGTPAWSGTSATVTRALRLISDGALDNEGNVDDLAARLGVTARHLRRLFDEHLGASPVAVAQARRVHFCRSLLDCDSLSITDIALISGFGSIRRFNTVFKNTFDQSPRNVRERRVARGAKDVGLELSLSFREPYDWKSMIGFLGPRALPGIELVDGNCYRRTVAFGDKLGVIEVAPAARARQLVVRLPHSLAGFALPIAERVRRLFDLSADSLAIESHLAGDPDLRAMVRRFPGTRVPGAWSPFEVSVRAVLGQQVSVKGATTLAGRLVEAYGTRFDSGVEGCDWIFPEPEKLMRARVERLGMPGARGQALRSLAAAVAADQIPYDGAVSLEETIEALANVRGIGPWTAHYVAMRACGEPDAFPSGDLALRRVVEEIDPGIKTDKQFMERSAAWRPWRSYAAMFMWRHYTYALSKKESR